MLESNYKPWSVKIEDFPLSGTFEDQIKFLIQFALLAPSTHNTQPWKFKIADNKIFICPNIDKALPVGDPNNHFLYISLGCALENLIVAAGHYGFSANITYPSTSKKEIEVSLIKEDKDNLAAREDLISYIPKRITNRHKFTDQLPDSKLLQLIEGLQMEDLQVHILTPGDKHDQIRSLVNVMTPALLNDPSFRKELSKYVRTNITSAKTGMPAFVMGVPILPSLIVPTILKFINLEKFNKKKQEGATNTKVFIVISTKQNNETNWVKSGQILEKINLLATKFGLYTHPMAAPLHSPGGPEKMQQILETSFYPQFLFRLGYGTKTPRHSPRMSVEDCLTLK